MSSVKGRWIASANSVCCLLLALFHYLPSTLFQSCQHASSYRPISKSNQKMASYLLPRLRLSLTASQGNYLVPQTHCTACHTAQVVMSMSHHYQGCSS
ncbi:hypothetical protein V8C44DRAFT_314020 [Trichoderma aethiopicum]